MLRNGHDHRLVVGCAVQQKNGLSPRVHRSSRRRDLAIAERLGDALEEYELVRVGDLDGVERADIPNDYVYVSKNCAIWTELLRRSGVALVVAAEVASL